MIQTKAYLNDEHKILLITNQLSYHKDLVVTLENFGCVIQCIKPTELSDQETQLSLNSHQINLVLIDDIFERDHSYELCHKLQDLELKIEIPVIFLGEKVTPQRKSQAFQSGAKDYIVIPYNKEEIITKVNTYVQLINLQRQVQDLTEQLSKLIPADPLTNVANQRYFLEYLEQEWSRCARERVSLGDGDYTMLSVIFLSVQGLDLIAEKYDQFQADQLLKQVADTLKNSLKRPMDLLARYADHIFAIILPNTDSQGLARVMNIIFEKIKSFQEQKADYLLSFAMGGVSRIPSRALSAEILIDVGLETLTKAQQKSDDRIILNTEEMDFDEEMD